MKRFFLCFATSFLIFSCGGEGEEAKGVGEETGDETTSVPSVLEFSADCDWDENGLRYLYITLKLFDKEGDYDKAAFRWVEAENPPPSDFEFDIGEGAGGERTATFEKVMIEASAANGDAILQVTITDKAGNFSEPATEGVCICIPGDKC